MAENSPVGNGPQQGTIRRVLLADDNDRYAEALTRDLRKRGAQEVIRVFDAASAVEKLRTEGDTIDTVVTDISMETQVSGLQVLRAARHGHPGRLVVVATTGLDTHLGFLFNRFFLGRLYKCDYLIPKKPIKQDGRVFWVPGRKK